MDRALVRDLVEARALFVGEWSAKRHRALNAVNEPILVLDALSTIFQVDTTLSQPHGNLLERPLLASRIKRHRHRNATAERREQQRVWIGPRIFATGRHRLVSDERVPGAITHFVAQVCLRSDNDLAHVHKIDASLR